MNTALRLCAALSLVIALGACSETEEPAAAPNTEKAPEPTALPTPPAPPEPAAAPAAAAGASTGVPECDEYLATFEKISTCDKLGPALEPMKTSVQAQKDSFAQWATMDEASRAAIQASAGPGCKAGTDGLVQTAQAMGCTL